MKTILASFLILFSISFNAFPQVKTLQLRDKIVNLSSYTKNGHISIFIFTIYGCAPCEKLKDELDERYSRNNKVDIFYCNIGEESDVRNWPAFKNKPVPSFWSNIERIYSFPTIYIYGPAGNLSYKYSDLNKEILAEIIDKINYLLDNIGYYNNLSNAQKPNEKIETDDYCFEQMENLKKQLSLLSSTKNEKPIKAKNETKEELNSQIRILEDSLYVLLSKNSVLTSEDSLLKHQLSKYKGKVESINGIINNSEESVLPVSLVKEKSDTPKSKFFSVFFLFALLYLLVFWPTYYSSRGGYGILVRL